MKFLKTLIGRLLVFFGGLLAMLGGAGLYAGSADKTILCTGILAIGILMVAAGIAIRI